MSKREYEVRETNSNREKESSTGFVMGAVIGGVIGACAAWLFTSKQGKELRQTLTDQAGTIVDKTSPLRETVKSKTISLSHGIVQQSTGLLNKVKGTAEQEEGADASQATYISISEPQVKQTAKSKPVDSEQIRKKLAEAQKAFDVEESKVK